MIEPPSNQNGHHQRQPEQVADYEPEAHGGARLFGLLLCVACRWPVIPPAEEIEVAKK
jgi:hypothetical protein